ncbi:MAG: type II toxin-antitoxin system MqsA family antitoxin [Planctomycetes bacterium]|nr:type II toxin-antitoxin system MqsA family antitoxin [Planctomycetota bacterium]
MNCLICKQGRTHPGHATVTLQQAGCTVIVKNVPAEVCDNCAEYYLSEETTRAILARAEAAAANGAEIELVAHVP